MAQQSQKLQVLAHQCHHPTAATTEQLPISPIIGLDAQVADLVRKAHGSCLGTGLGFAPRASLRARPPSNLVVNTFASKLRLARALPSKVGHRILSLGCLVHPTGHLLPWPWSLHWDCPWPAQPGSHSASSREATPEVRDVLQTALPENLFQMMHVNIFIFGVGAGFCYCLWRYYYFCHRRPEVFLLWAHSSIFDTGHICIFDIGAR